MSKLPPYNSYWVVPQKLMAGEYPGHPFNQSQTPRRLDALLEAGITTCINLTEAHERIPYAETLQERAGYYGVQIEHKRYEIGDFGIPSREKMQKILKTIHAVIENGGKPYIHCWAGLGRTGTVVGCYLVESGLNGKEALAKVQALCYYGLSPQTDAQREFVYNWQK